MTLNHLKAELDRRDITLHLEDEKLVADDPHRRLTPPLDEAIRFYRDDLIKGLQPISAVLGTLYSTEGKERPDLSCMTIDEFAAAVIRQEVYASKLDDVIIIASNNHV